MAMNAGIRKVIKSLIRATACLVPAITAGCMFLTQPFYDPVPSTPPPVSSERLEQHVRFLSETVYPRNYLAQDNLNAAADYILDYLRQNGADVSEQHFIVDGRSYRNILTHYGPQSDSVIVVGAHYDSHDVTPGADDNASGVAGLLELARLLNEHPPTQAVELVAYTLEEPPFFRTDNMGSAVHAKALADAKRRVRIMISLEMIGYFDDHAGSQTYPVGFLNALYPTEGNFIAVIGRFADAAETRRVKALMTGATDLPVHSINAPAWIEGVDFSDHRNYWAQGMNAVMISDTAFFRNYHYHQLSDSAEKLDYQRMAKVVQGVYAVVQHFESE
jgi:Zn-dependent M28 family amino/carboxypeptidase